MLCTYLCEVEELVVGHQVGCLGHGVAHLGAGGGVDGRGDRGEGGEVLLRKDEPGVRGARVGDQGAAGVGAQLIYTPTHQG